MWISRRAFDTLTAERITAAAEARVLADQNAAYKITMDWMRHRVQQLEHERAYLLKTYMGVVVQVPTFVKPEPEQDDVLGGANIFQDIGHEAAERLGIKWDELGVVK